MRKLPAILALLGLAASISARSARADGVTYTVMSMYGPDVPTTSVSAKDSSFKFVFTVPSTTSVIAGNVDLMNVTVTFTSTSTSPILPSFMEPAELMFAPAAPPMGNPGGLFDICIPNCNSTDFVNWTFFGPQIFSLNSTDTEATFLPGLFMIMGGTGFPTPTGSFFFDLSGPTFIGGDLTGGTVSGAAVTPEPSSMLLLASGLLALGGFARRRLIARFD